MWLFPLQSFFHCCTSIISYYHPLHCTFSSHHHLHHTPRHLVCSRRLNKQAALPLPHTQARVGMELTRILMEMQPAGLPPLYQLFALVCLVAIIYKVTTVIVKRNDMLRHFKAFPGPPGHWLFGHSLRVLQRIYMQQYLSDSWRQLMDLQVISACLFFSLSKMRETWNRL